MTLEYRQFTVVELISLCNPTARCVVQVIFWFESKAGQNILVKPTKVG